MNIECILSICKFLGIDVFEDSPSITEIYTYIFMLVELLLNPKS